MLGWRSRLRRCTGTGLFKANISPLIAEQYRRTKQFVVTTKSGERVIVDPSLTVSRMYMVRRQLPIGVAFSESSQYFYLFINIGAVIGQISMTYAEKVHLFLTVHSHDVYAIIVRRLLARLHITHRHLPSVPFYPFLRTQPLCPHTSDRVSALHRGPAMEICCPWPMEP
jgi:hypothetical protein